MSQLEEPAAETDLPRFVNIQKSRSSEEPIEPLESPNAMHNENSSSTEISQCDQPCGFFTDWHLAMQLGSEEQIETLDQGQDEENSTMTSLKSYGGLSQTFSLFPRRKASPEDGSYI